MRRRSGLADRIPDAGDEACLVDEEDVEPDRRPRPFGMLRERRFGGLIEAALLTGREGEGSLVVRGPCLDLGEDEDVGARGDEVDFSRRGAEIAGEHRPPRGFEPGRDLGFRRVTLCLGDRAALAAGE